MQAEDVAEEPKDESSIMNGAQSETVSVSDSSESSPEDDNPEMSDMETAKQISAVTNHGGLSVLDIKAMLRNLQTLWLKMQKNTNQFFKD